jgi:hypothetical protein
VHLWFFQNRLILFGIKGSPNNKVVLVYKSINEVQSHQSFKQFISKKQIYL